MDNNSRIDDFYNDLVQSGFTFGGKTDRASYDAMMADDARSKKLYGILTDRGWDLDDYDTWRKGFSSQQPNSSEQSTGAQPNTAAQQMVQGQQSQPMQAPQGGGEDGNEFTAQQLDGINPINNTSRLDPKYQLDDNGRVKPFAMLETESTTDEHGNTVRRPKLVKGADGTDVYRNAMTGEEYSPLSPEAMELVGQNTMDPNQYARKTNDPTWGETLGKGFGSGFTRVGAQVVDVLQQLSSGMYVESGDGYIRTQSYDEAIKDKNNALTKASDVMHATADRMGQEAKPYGGQKGFLDLLWDGKIGSAFQMGLATAGESLPMTLSAFNPYTMVGNGILMAAGNYRDQTLENPDVPEWKRATYAIGQAAIEQAVEKYADPVFKYFGGKKAVEQVTKEATQSVAKRIFKALGGMAKGVAKDMNDEGMEEVATNFGNDILGSVIDWMDGQNDYGYSAQFEALKKENPDADLWDYCVVKAKESVESYLGGAISAAYTSGTAQGLVASAKGLSYAVNHDSNENVPDGVKLDPVTVNVAQSFDDGYSFEIPQEKNDAKNMYDVQRERMNGIVDEDTLNDIEKDPLSWIVANKDNLVAEDLQTVLDYVNAKATYDGMIQKVSDDIESQCAAFDELIDSRTNRAGANAGMLVPATMKMDDRQVFVIDGDIQMLDDGSMVDVSKSSESILVRDADTGKLEFVSPRDVLNVGEAVDAEQEKAMVREDTTRQMAQEQAQQMEGVLAFNAGDVYSILDNQGNTNQVEVLADNGDGTVMVSIDGSEPMPYPKDVLQQLSDNESKARAAERAAMNSAENATANGTAENGEGVAQPAADAAGTVAGTDVEASGTGAEAPAANAEGTVAAEPMPMVGEGDNAEPDFLATTPERGLSFLFGESGWEESDADAFLANNVTASAKEVEKLEGKRPKAGTNFAKFNKDMAAWNASKQEAAAKAEYWQKMKELRDAMVAEKNAERKAAEQARQDAERAAAEQDEAAYRAEQERLAAEQAERGSNVVGQNIIDKWNSAEKVVGAADELVLPNGEKVKGHYVLVESGAASPSHDANNGFVKSDGFPVDVNGNSVNDRDYERDKDAQRVTRQMADNYDARAIQNTVVVSGDGVVLSGNGRTMAGELAAAQNTDGAYVEALKMNPGKFGFTASDMEGMEHPRVVFVLDEAMPYTAETFAKFNQQEMKSQSKTEQAVKLGKVVDDATYNRIVKLISGFERLTDFYNDQAAAREAISELQKAGVISDAQVAEMLDGEGISNVGRDVLENMLVGKAFDNDPDAVRKISELRSMRQAIIMALSEISANKALGEDYSLENELAQAIDLVYQARKSGGYKAGERVSGYARQGNLDFFGENATVGDITNATVMQIADIINDNKPSMLKTYLKSYNEQSALAASGQLDLFSGGLESKQDILNNAKQLDNEQSERQEPGAASAEEAGTIDNGGEGSEAGGPDGRNGSGNSKTAQTRESDPQEKVAYGLSTEKNEYGKSFVTTKNGSTEFGFIRGYEGLTDAPVKLSIGENVKDEKGTNHGYGLVHILAHEGREDAIKRAGFESVEDFVEAVINDPDKKVKVGHVVSGAQTYLVEVVDGNNNTLFIQLSKDGSYWNVNSAGIFRPSYSRNKKEVNTLPAVGSSAITDTAGVAHGTTTGEAITNGNSPLDKNESLSDGSAVITPTTDAASANVSTLDAQESGEQSGSASNQSEGSVSAGKGSNNSATDQTQVGENDLFSQNEGETEGADSKKAPTAEPQGTVAAAIAAAEAETDTNPSEAQKEAGNYKKGHVKVDGYDITIENPKGSERSGKDADGKEWSVTMNNTYGYIRGTEGVDGDHIDVFLSDNPEQGNVYVVDQVDADGNFDEHKVMYGFGSAEEARDNYLANYSEGWKMGTITEVSKDEFKKWIESSHRKTKPFSEYKSVKKEGAQGEEQKSADANDVTDKDVVRWLKEDRELRAVRSDGQNVESFDDYMRRVATSATDRLASRAYVYEVYGENVPEAIEDAYPYVLTKENAAEVARDLKQQQFDEDGCVAILRGILKAKSEAILPFLDEVYGTKKDADEKQQPSTAAVDKAYPTYEAGTTFTNGLGESLRISEVRTDEKGETYPVVEYINKKGDVTHTETMTWEYFATSRMKKPADPKREYIMQEKAAEGVETPAAKNEGDNSANKEIDADIAAGNTFRYVYTESGRKQYHSTNYEQSTTRTISKADYDYAKANGGKMMSDEEAKDLEDENRYQQLLKWAASQYPSREIEDVIASIENGDNDFAKKNNLPKLKELKKLMNDSRKRLDRLTSDGKAYEGETLSLTPDEPTKEKPSANKNDEKIEDVGEKIGGARKDATLNYAKKIDLEATTPSKIFPKPNFASMEKAGVPHETLVKLKAYYTAFSITNKNKRKRNENQRILSARFYASIARDMLLRDVDVFNESADGIVLTEYGKQHLELLVACVEALDKKGMAGFFDLDISDVDVHIGEFKENEQGAYQTKDGKRWVGTYSFGRTNNKAAIGYKLFDLDDMEGLAEEYCKQVEAAHSKNVQNEIKMHVYRVSTGTCYISAKVKGIADEIKLKDGFATSKEAFDYIRENGDALKTEARAKADEMKQGKKNGGTRKPTNDDIERMLRNIVQGTRIGKDYRNGKDVSADDFMKEFGFRGVEFGNWATQKERQDHLNACYDALMDLADLIGISPKAISLGGKLAMAFGSRGRSSALAHYEPAKHVINLTKEHGAGCVAHEWFHAVDNYFGGGVFGLHMKSAVEGNSRDNLRSEMQKIFTEIGRALNGSDMKSRSKKLGNGDYWASTLEMAARAFESYVNERLMERGQKNQYLSAHVPGEAVQYEELAKNDPYPTAEESKKFGEIFDRLFDTVQEEVGDDGNVNLFQIADVEPGTENVTEAQQLATEAIITALGENAGIDVVMETREEGQLVAGMEDAGAELMAVEAVKDETLDYFRKSVSGDITGKPMPIGKLTPEGREYLMRLSGIDMKEDVDFVLNPSDMTHIYNEHYGENEKDPGNNNPLNDDDIRNIVDIIENPDEVVFFIDLKHDNRKTFIFFKETEVDGVYNLAEVYGDRKGNLTAKSLYKTKKGISQREDELINSPHTTSVTTGASLSFGAKIPQLFELPKLSDGNQPNTAEFMQVWHGSAAVFDHFDGAFMGSGEGSQVYGDGHYVTGVESTGRMYATIATENRQRSSEPIVRWKGQQVDFSSVNPLRMAHDVADSSRTIKEARDRAERYADMAEEDDMKTNWALALDILKQSTKAEFKPVPVKGNRQLYEVEIPDDNGSNYLDWNGKVGARVLSKVAKLLSENGVEIDEAELRKRVYEMPSSAKGGTGFDLYDWLKSPVILNSKKEASRILSEAGFVGIKVPTGNRRGGDGRGMNYVIFNDNDLKITDRVQFMQRPEGTVYGWSEGNRIHLTPEGINPNTPIHEYTHLWAKAVMQKNPKLWNRIKELLQGTPIWEEVVNDPAYQGLTSDDAIASEALSRLSGRKNAGKMEKMAQDLLNEAKGNGVFAEANAHNLILKMKQALKDFWKWVGVNLFDMNDVKNIDEVTDRVLYDMLNKTDLEIGENGSKVKEMQMTAAPDSSSSVEDRPLSMTESMIQGLITLAQKNKENAAYKTYVVKAIGGELAKLRKAMSAQKEYDRSTVEQMTGLARLLIKNGMLSNMSEPEMLRLLTIIKNATGRNDITKAAQQVYDLMIKNQLDEARSLLDQVTRVKDSKVNAQGVEVQGTLDVRGQQLIKAFRKAMSLDEANISELLQNASDRMDSPDAAIADEAATEYAALTLALQYVHDIKDSVADEKLAKEELEKAREAHAAKTDGLSAKAYKEYVQEAEDAIRQKKLERIEAYHNLAARLAGAMQGSIESAKQFREREMERVKNIHHFANSDMQGRPANAHRVDNWKQKVLNNPFFRFMFNPLGTFDQMLRMIGNKSVNGEGYLYNHFMRGWLDATQKEFENFHAACKVLDDKASEVFGKKMRWSDLYAEERKMPKAQITFTDVDGSERTVELNQGNLLYIYMAEKMADGRMKLRAMGITEEDIENIKEVLDPRFVKLADWLQEEFLVQKRNDYNAVHERMFGAPMAAIENYFPLRILGDARVQQVDVAEDKVENELPSILTGSIIKRRTNKNPLDVMNTDAFSVVVEHLQQMEKWAAFAEWRRDLNTLLSYKRFRNQLKNMSSVYGAGNTLWRNFMIAGSIAAGTHRPKVDYDGVDTTVVNLAKGVTTAKIAFRVFTAIKQLLSAPAFMAEANWLNLAKSIATPWKAWNWAMEELPTFKKRWQSKQAGDSRLMKTDVDWRFWKNRLVETLSRWGMSPNAFVDAMTVAIGGRAIYETKYARYIEDGYSEAEADKKAKQDAAVLVNQTQQSSETAFVSKMQLDRTVAAVSLSVFRNSPMSYQRQLVDAIRGLKRMATPGYKEESIDFMAKQMVRDGLDEDAAKRAATRAYNREWVRNLSRTALFGFGMQMAWNLGAYLPYLIFGDDDDEKKEMLEDAAVHGLFGSIEGLSGGNLISELGNMKVKGESLRNYDMSLLPLMSDIRNIYTKLETDEVAAVNDMVNLLVQSGIGVNPQTITDAIVAITDACNGDVKTGREATMLFLRLSQAPQSQIDKLYLDEIGMRGKEASKLSVQDLAKRYAQYKKNRNAPLAQWAYSDEAEQKVIDKHIKKFETQAKERLMQTTGDAKLDDAYEAYEENYKDVKKRLEAVNKLKDEDFTEFYTKMGELATTPEFRKYDIFKGYKSVIDKLKKAALDAKDGEEREHYLQMIDDRKRQMVERLDAMK